MTPQEMDQLVRRANAAGFDSIADYAVHVEAHRTLLRDVGEKMFRGLYGATCDHAQPRSPFNETCMNCQRKAAAMDAWDEALMTTRLPIQREAA